MRNSLLTFVLAVAAVGASGQPFVGGFTSFPPQPTPSALLSPVITSTPEIPLWNYSVTAGAGLGGGTYNGSIIGRSPFLKGKTTTTIPLQIIPVKITINNGGGDTHTYDPTINNGCDAGGFSATQIVQNSPVFTNTTWNMDGQNVGTTQYHDADLRATFWSLVQGTPYHLIENVSVIPLSTTTTWYFGSVGDGVHTPLGPGTNYNVPATFGGGCGYMGVVNINDLGNALNNTVALLSPTVNISTLPMLLTDSVVSADVGTSIYSTCCALGFHSSYPVGPNLQVTSIFVLEYSGLFGNTDVSVISHELGEAIFDPNGVNPTPVWGSIGQDAGNCPSKGGQNNLEVGDPLSPGFGAFPNEHVITPGTSSNEWSLLGTGLYSTVQYHLQELTFFDWFFGDTPHLGIPGYFSNNGTFQGAAILCSAGGGTN